jgi:hypothetical protein
MSDVPSHHNQTAPQQHFRLFDLPREIQLMIWERIFHLCPEIPNQGFLIALAPNQTLYREARYEWLKSAYVTIRNPVILMQRSVEELKLLKQVHIIWEQRW